MPVTDRRLRRGARVAGLLGAASLVGAMLWLRRHPSACPYSLRFSLEPPHPLITRARLREILAPQPGERILEIGPATGYYTLELAEWISGIAGSELMVFDQLSHAGLHEDPETFNRATLDFLLRQRS